MCYDIYIVCVFLGNTHVYFIKNHDKTRYSRTAFLIFRNALGDMGVLGTLQTVYGSEMPSIARKYVG